MSDVTVAPSGGGSPQAAPQSASAPAPQEAQINTNPTYTPNPVGSQAPDAPQGRAETARDSVQRAYERAQNPPPKGQKPPERPAPKPAEAKLGHNQPPEETPKFDLKKRPSEQVAEPQPRDKGRFAPRAPAEGAQNNAQNAQNSAQPAQGQQQPYRKLPSHEPYAEPPGRMSEQAKREWAAAPASVRGDIHRMQDEFVRAYQFYKGDYEAFKPVKKFHDMALQHNTTLERALTNYTTMEQKLRSDPLGGLDLIVHNLNLVDPQSGKRLDLRDIAYTVLSQTPEQLKQMQQGNVQQAANQQIGALHAKIEGLENTLKQWQTQSHFNYNRAAVDQFATSHPRIDDPGFGAAVQREIGFGFPLEEAYRRAELLHPATHAAQTRTTPAQTRTQDRSISGAPDVTPSNGASQRRPKDPSPTPYAAVQNALARLNGVH